MAAWSATQFETVIKQKMGWKQSWICCFSSSWVWRSSSVCILEKIDFQTIPLTIYVKEWNLRIILNIHLFSVFTHSLQQSHSYSYILTYFLRWYSFDFVKTSQPNKTQSQLKRYIGKSAKCIIYTECILSISNCIQYIGKITGVNLF